MNSRTIFLQVMGALCLFSILLLASCGATSEGATPSRAAIASTATQAPSRAANTETPPPTPAATSTPQPTATPPSAGMPKGMGQDPKRLVIPAVKMDYAVKDATWTTIKQKGTLYSDWVIPYDAVGHLNNSVKPGEQGNMVISGHHNLTGPNIYGKGLFAGLWDLKEGDLIYMFDAANRVFQYHVTKSYPLKEAGEPLAVREQHARDVLKEDGKPHAVLITCWNGKTDPLASNTYRWIIQSDLVGPVDPAQVPTVQPSETPKPTPHR